MNKIANIVELPAWYNRAAYDGTETFKAKDWYRELVLRRELLDRWKWYRSPHNDDARNSPPDAGLVEVTEAVHKHPIETMLPENYLSRESLRYRLQIPKQKKSVRTLTFADLAYQKNLDTFAEKAGMLGIAENCPSENVSACWSELSAETYTPSDTLDEKVLLTEYSLASFPRAGLFVDLNAPDSLLVAEFKDWLATARPTMCKDKPDRRALYGRWGKYGLLPYLDLMIWAVAEDANIIDKVMAQAISKHHNMGEENVRKTVAPLAERLFQLINELQTAMTMEWSVETSAE